MDYRLNTRAPDPSLFQVPKLRAVSNYEQSRGIGASDLKYTAGGSSTGVPPLAIAGLTLDAAQFGYKVLSSKKQRDEAEAAAERAEKRYQAELERLKKLDAQREEQIKLSNEMTAGRYGMDLEGQTYKYYGQYM